MAEPMRPTMVRMPPEMVSELRRLAAENDRTIAAEIRRALRLHLSEEANVAPVAETPRQPAPSPPGELCGAWDMGDGGCTMPKGHNMGKVDVPGNHAFPRQPAPSEEKP